MSAERYQRISTFADLRQADLTVCLEQVHKPHNVSAVLRSCDAVGIHTVHAVATDENVMRKDTAMGAEDWVFTQRHGSIQAAVEHFHQQKMQVLVTHLDDEAVDFREIDYTLPTAIILGQEKFGATPEALALADKKIIIPMVGMVQSLNVSVAAALVLYEAQRQRQQAGLYQRNQLSFEQRQILLFKGGFPRLYALCEKKGIGHPPIDESGKIVAGPEWWQQLQFSEKHK
ncbi:tRNA (guanosine(18)-2'-O)-methyltransferase TrmH [Paraglaciecola hydrolytica]|uniref:tRNA (guanosine(18)-2'-O)-methyltransferase n=1 Tax=Paraglaciecola hydrolytica TaxID=1799789 RepID=A0A148KKS0_9ALTE|nr:tRNA (guanosine(18)-2'-O)-methyltransferase TrmH [Paraglaciecola hydrolytica]KXI26914.1 tRNA (guanosine(18)-2'-O)-methyltransferase TrmH [Paraglaciecola hydrolytica]